MRRATRRILLAALGVSSLGAKCVEYEADVELPDPNASAVDIAVPCSTPFQANLGVEEFDFPILCGCEEEPWGGEENSKTCTIPAGTTVTWHFTGARDNRVASLGGTFGESPDRTTGQFRHTFEEPGEYPYGCGIHKNSMAGYAIHVR